METRRDHGRQSGGGGGRGEQGPNLSRASSEFPDSSQSSEIQNAEGRESKRILGKRLTPYPPRRSSRDDSTEILTRREKGGRVGGKMGLAGKWEWKIELITEHATCRAPLPRPTSPVLYLPIFPLSFFFSAPSAFGSFFDTRLLFPAPFFSFYLYSDLLLTPIYSFRSFPLLFLVSCFIILLSFCMCA